MKILVIGGGGREHAVVKKLLESPKVTQLFAAPGNGGIGRDAVCADIKAADIPAMVDFAVKKAIDFAVITPDDPLVLGMADAMREAGIRCFGPSKAAAQIEGSKIFSKALMKRYGIPTAAYESFGDITQAVKYADEAAYPLWIKADGLALGKGAIYAGDASIARAVLNRLMVDKTLGESGSRVVIEEHMSGSEVTVLAFTDGQTIRPMPSSMDHKRALDGNRGPNTGGMGAIVPNPFYTRETAERCMEEIFLPTIRAMKAEGRPFAGCLYFGMILTETGPKVIEYNCRFGDPETQALLPMLESDLLDIMVSTQNGMLAAADIRWKAGASACVVMASGGYPGAYETGKHICGLDENGGMDGVFVYHAGTEICDGFRTAGGRVLGITASSDTLIGALDAAYRAVGRVTFEGAHYRKDIGSGA